MGIHNEKLFIQTRCATTLARARYFLALLKANLLGRMDPLLVVLVVNNRCNFNCQYCFGDYHNRKTPDYTTAEIKLIVDKTYAMGTRYLNIHGGEALLRNDIGEIVNYVKRKGMYCCLITNGSLLPQKLDEVRNVDNLTISLDGRPENNDQVRGKGTYALAMRGIDLALQQKIPLRVSATLTRYTMNDIEYLANLAKKHGFFLYYSILFQPISGNPDFVMDDQEIRIAIQRIIELKKAGYPIETSYASLEYARQWPLNHNHHHFVTANELGLLPKTFRPIKCYYSQRKFIIEADGNVWPCFILSDPAIFTPLNWREVGIEKAIRHVQETNTCKTCPGLSQNDHNLLLGLNLKQLASVIKGQFKEALRRK